MYEHVICLIRNRLQTPCLSGQQGIQRLHREITVILLKALSSAAASRGNEFTTSGAHLKKPLHVSTKFFNSVEQSFVFFHQE